MSRRSSLSPLTLISLLYLLVLLPSTTTAQQQQQQQSSTIPTNSSATTTTPTSSPPSTSSLAPLKIESGTGTSYEYAGCWNESAGLPGTTNQRALTGGNEVLPGTMTVGLCLEFCARHGSGGEGEGGSKKTKTKVYRFAGLEYSRECWCGDALSVLSVRLPDNFCDTPCDGANGTACGGALRLSLYNATSLPASDDETGGAAGRGEARVGVVLGMVGLVMGFALAGL